MAKMSFLRLTFIAFILSYITGLISLTLNGISSVPLAMGISHIIAAAAVLILSFFSKNSTALKIGIASFYFLLITIIPMFFYKYNSRTLLMSGFISEFHFVSGVLSVILFIVLIAKSINKKK